VWLLWFIWLFLGLFENSGCFCVYLYPQSHSKPDIFPFLRDMGRHLLLQQLVLFLWMCHNAFASSKVIVACFFAEVRYHTRQHAKATQNAGMAIRSMSIMVFHFLYVCATLIQYVLKKTYCEIRYTTS
jgi:hypothetical protein